MNRIDFKIKILRQHWIKDDGVYDKEDLCSHGELYIHIGTEVLSKKESGTWTLSATGLYLLRTLEQDYKIGQYGSQLVPCCGHFMIPDENGKNNVLIIGCPNGIDWSITHLNNEIFFLSENGAIGKLSFEEYKEIVLKFVDEVELFYGKPSEKNVDDYAFDINGFYQFWAEWNELKKKWTR